MKKIAFWKHLFFFCSSPNIIWALQYRGTNYMIQLDTQWVLNELTLFVFQDVALHVSDLTGPSSGALNSCMWMMIHGIASSMPFVRPVHSRRKNYVLPIPRTITHIQLFNAPEDRPVRSETCRATSWNTNKVNSLRTHCVASWII
jgi:hypothetical protein